MNTIQIIGLIGVIGYFIIIGVKGFIKADFDRAAKMVFCLLILLGIAAFIYEHQIKGKAKEVLTYEESQPMLKVGIIIGGLPNIDTVLSYPVADFEARMKRYANNPYQYRYSAVESMDAPDMGALYKALNDYHEREHRKETIKQQINDLRKELNSIK